MDTKILGEEGVLFGEGEGIEFIEVWEVVVGERSRADEFIEYCVNVGRFWCNFRDFFEVLKIIFFYF